jgi:hypothetical protein
MKGTAFLIKKFGTENHPKRNNLHSQINFRNCKADA